MIGLIVHLSPRMRSHFSAVWKNNQRFVSPSIRRPTPSLIMLLSAKQETSHLLGADAEERQARQQINPSVQYETKWVSERSVWMLRSDAFLRYGFFYSGDNDYRNSVVSFCNTALLLISDFFSTPIANQKKARYNMTRRTEMVIFKEVRPWLLPITRLSSSARRC